MKEMKRENKPIFLDFFFLPLLSSSEKTFPPNRYQGNVGTYLESTYLCFVFHSNSQCLQILAWLSSSCVQLQMGAENRKTNNIFDCLLVA